MTVTTNVPSNQYSGDGVNTGPFEFDFPIYSAGELKVRLIDDSDGSATLLTLTTHYTITGGGGGTGSVTMVSAPAVGITLDLRAEYDLLQSANIVNQSRFLPETHQAVFDRLTYFAQYLERLLGSTLRIADTQAAAVADLGDAETRKGKYPYFNATTGAPELATLLSGSPLTQLIFDGFLEDSQASIINGLLYPQTATELAQLLTPVNLSIPHHDACGYVNPWRYFTSAQLTSVKAYNYAQDVTTALQAAMNLAWNAQVPIFVPGGGYQVTGLTLPGQAARRDRSFIMRGAGAGEIFATLNTGSTIIRSTTNANVLIYTPDSANTGNGHADISYIEWRQDNTSATAAVIRFISWYDKSHFHHCNVYQGGDGDGIVTELVNTSSITENYIINGDWNTSGLGAARTGCALRMTNSIQAGGGFIISNTFRGFKDGLIIAGTGQVIYRSIVRDNECSVIFNGITISALCRGAVVEGTYIEGGDSGVAITNRGNYSRIRDNLIFPGFSKCIDDSDANSQATVIEGNTASAGSTPNTTLIDVASSGASGGGYAKRVVANMLTFSGSGGSVAGVIGMRVSGVEPRIALDNHHDPRGDWTGGAGTAKYSDASTGGGSYGFQHINAGNFEFPLIARGALQWGYGSQLGNSSIVANILTLTGATFHILNCTSAQTINGFAAASTAKEGKVFVIFTLNNNATFANTASLVMAGAANYTPGANGAMLTFIVYTGVVRECSRTAY